MRGNFENISRLVRLILRRERIMSAVWVVILLLFSVGLAPVLGTLFDEASRAAYAETLNNPAMVAMMGPVYGIGNYTAGAMYSNAMLLWMIITIGIMNIFLVVRHTRADEEKGRTEIVRSLPTGRLANLSATMITAIVVNGALALLTGLGVAAMGIESMDFNGSMLYGAVLGVSGLFFAAVAALFAQLSSSSRGAIGLSVVALGVIYVMRAAGDLSSEALSLISPMGLIQRTQIYVENHWWPVFVLLIEAAVVIAAAYALNAVRDMGQGFIHAKPGRKEASSMLRSPFGLAYRLSRNMIIAWTVGMFILGASYGAILDGIDEFVASNEFYQQLIGSHPDFTLAQMFVSMVAAIMALIALASVLITIMKPRSEEKDGYTESVLARAVSRGKYLSGYAVLAFAGSVLVQCAIAIGLYMSAVAVLPDPGDLTLGYLLKANLVYVPAMWVMIGVAVLLIGLAPKATSAIWGYYGFTFFAFFIGRIPNLLPDWLEKITPFGYVPQLPVDSVNYATLTALVVIAVALTIGGIVFYRKRDLVA